MLASKTIIATSSTYWNAVVPVAQGFNVSMPADYVTRTGVVYTGTQDELLTRYQYKNVVTTINNY